MTAMFQRGNSRAANKQICDKFRTADQYRFLKWLGTGTKIAAACDFQQLDILTSVDSDEPLQHPFKLRNFK